ncbi:MAG: DHHA1 domain-containing protein [Archaeoglobaceae archaeon]
MLDVLQVEAGKAAELINKHQFVRIFAHYDADGISSASILGAALFRNDTQFQVSFLNGLREPVDSDPDELVIFQDMGSGQPDIISQVDSDVVIADHHYPSGKVNAEKGFVHVNPHLAGIDGTYELSASGVAYVIANQLDDNADLSGLALVGIYGDKQKITGGNAEIVKEGVQNGYITEKNGLNLHSGKIGDVLPLSTEPYLDFYENTEELKEFLESLNIDEDTELDQLNGEEVQKLSNAIVLRVLDKGGFEGSVDGFVGKKFVLNNEVISNPVTLSEVVDSCGRASEYGTGFSICLRDENYVDRGMKLWRKFKIELLEELKKRKNEIKEGESIRYIVMEDAPTTSAIATVLSRYLFSDKPLLVANLKKNTVKISSRSNSRVAERVDLADIMHKVAEEVGGRGGGHRVAAGANIEPEKLDEFIKEVDRLVGQSIQQ